jgi:membrane dipeptidase
MIKIIGSGITILVLIIWAVLEFVVPAEIESSLNSVNAHEPYEISSAAQALHKKLLVADVHADSLLMKRDLNKHEDRGHLDIPRLQIGNVALQVFAAATKLPSEQNNDTDYMTFLAMIQLWPIKTWFSIVERALYQAKKLEQFAKESEGKLVFVKNQQELNAVLAQRKDGSDQIAALYGIEGAHSLEGNLDNVQVLFDAGVRLMGVTHYFDNKLAGSFTGLSGDGLTDFGRKAVLKAVDLGIIIDIAHLSTKAVEEILALSDKPVILSHSGMKGVCDTAKNFPDDLVKKVVAQGGLVGIGYYKGTVCDSSPEGIVRSIRYAIDTLGVDSVALGSDFDAPIAVDFDASELAVLTHTMLAQNFTEEEITKVMGANAVDFFSRYLPID